MNKQIDFKELDKQICCPDEVLVEKVGNIKVLEIGFDDTKHLLFQKSKGVRYYDIDISETLVKEAFILDLQNDFFDHCFTINTLYFWKNPIPNFMEIYRILKSGGKLSLAFIEKKFGEKLLWTQPDFTFYEVNEVKKLFRRTGFANIEVKQMTGEITRKDGQEITGPFVLISGQK